jgi:hypothetical protein
VQETLDGSAPNVPANSTARVRGGRQQRVLLIDGQVGAAIGAVHEVSGGCGRIDSAADLDIYRY